MSRPRARVLAWLATGVLGLAATRCDAPERPLAAPRPERPRAGDVAEATGTPDPALVEALRGVLLERDALLRAERLAARLRTLEPTALPSVLRAYDSVLVDRGELPVLLLAEWWARFAPADAFAWATTEGIAQESKVMIAVVEAWATTDPQAARLAFEGLRNPALRDAALAGLAYGWTDADERAALDWVRSLSRGFERQAALAYLVRRKLLRQGVEPTLRWADAVEDEPPRFKLDVIRRVAAGAARVEPRRSAEWALRQMDEPHGAAALRLATVQWAGIDGAAAMAFLAQVPAGAERDDAVQETYRRWLKSDKAAARSWLPAQPPAPWLEPALAIHALSVSVESPEEALRLVAGVHDEQRRQEAVVKIARRWRAMDAAQAEAWVASETSLTPEMEQRIMAPLRPPRPGRAAQADPSAAEAGSVDRRAAAAEGGD